MNELQNILGGSWRFVWLYPGGVALLMAAVLMRVGVQTGSRSAVDVPGVATVVPIWMCCSMLPWPRTYWAYPIDLWVAFLLLEAPYWAWLHRRGAATERIIDLLRIYPLLILAMGMLAQSAGSLLIVRIQAAVGWPRWMGVGLWCIAVPPLISLGPWRQHDEPAWAIDARRAGHLALLTVMALPRGEASGYAAAVIGTLCVFGSFLLLDRLWHDRSARAERWQPTITVGALAVVFGIAMQQFYARYGSG
ncbi:MAG: hypothetical protein NVS4B8_04460 [Herpetosiphon sp.]